MEITKKQVMEWLRQPAVIVLLSSAFGGVFGSSVLEGFMPNHDQEIQQILERLDEHDQAIKSLKVVSVDE